jgi:hypothetical protein
MSSLQPPNLDDRTFEDLVAKAINYVRGTSSAWDDLSFGDPGRVLLEAFAYITEIMIYRLNRLPEKVYIEFLRLIGVKLYPPGVAHTHLVFNIVKAQSTPIPIDKGTIVSTVPAGKAAPPVTFSTVKDTLIPAGETTSSPVLAYHGTWIEAELAGAGTGQPGLSVTALQRPIVVPTPELDHTHLFVGVEVGSSESESFRPEYNDKKKYRRVDNKLYRIWREVDSFANLNPNREADQFVYMVDRVTGTITFAPKVNLQPDTNGEATLLAKVPPPGKEILLWYRSGGGLEGNVPAQSLIVPKTQFPEAESEVAVTNPAPATGGSAGESLQNAVERGRLELRSLRRAVTASDFEILATRPGNGVRQAKAWAKAQRWKYVSPGTVEVLLVPEEQGLSDKRLEEIRSNVQDFLDSRKPLGTTCIVRWARLKRGSIDAVVETAADEDKRAIKRLVEERLNELLDHCSEAFGKGLTRQRVERQLESLPGVEAVSAINFRIDESPQHPFTSLAEDPLHENVFYAASGPSLFQTENGGKSWERFWPPNEYDLNLMSLDNPDDLPSEGHSLVIVAKIGDSYYARIFNSLGSMILNKGPNEFFPDVMLVQELNEALADEAIYKQVKSELMQKVLSNLGHTHENVIHVQAHPYIPGRVAIITTISIEEQNSSTGHSENNYFHCSFECGETWQFDLEMGFRIYDIEWLARANRPLLLLATTEGLYSIELPSAENPHPVLNDITVDVNNPDLDLYAVTSIQDLDGQLHVAVSAENRTIYLLSNHSGQLRTSTQIKGFENDVRLLKFQKDGDQIFLWAEIHEEVNKGMCRWELGTSSGWKSFPNWQGQSCTALSFNGAEILVGTNYAGVLWLNPTVEGENAKWHIPSKDCNLPLSREYTPGGGYFPLSIQALASQTISGKAQILVAILGKAEIYRGFKTLSSKRQGTEQQEQDLFFETSTDISLPETWSFQKSDSGVQVTVQEREHER